MTMAYAAGKYNCSAGVVHEAMNGERGLIRFPKRLDGLVSEDALIRPSQSSSIP